MMGLFLDDKNERKLLARIIRLPLKPLRDVFRPGWEGQVSL